MGSKADFTDLFIEFILTLPDDIILSLPEGYTPQQAIGSAPLIWERVCQQAAAARAVQYAKERGIQANTSEH